MFLAPTPMTRQQSTATKRSRNIFILRILFSLADEKVETLQPNTLLTLDKFVIVLACIVSAGL